MYEEINISDAPEKFIDFLRLMTDDRQYNKCLINNIYNGYILTSREEIQEYCDDHRTCFKDVLYTVSKRKHKKTYITTEKLWIDNIEFEYTDMFYYRYEETIWLRRNIMISVKSNIIAHHFNAHILIMKKG